MVSFFIARRHLFSRKSHAVVNLIACVSVVAMAVPVMALVVILSFHNGLSDFIDRMYSEFDSQLRITPLEGGMFAPSDSFLRQVEALPEVEVVSQVIEQHVLITYGGNMPESKQWVAIMRGVDSLYEQVVDIRGRIMYGQYAVRHGDLERAVVGQGVAYALGVGMLASGSTTVEPLAIHAIRPGMAGGGTSFLPLSLYRTQQIVPGGIFGLDEQTDSRYIFVPLEFAGRLLNAPGRVSALEVKFGAGISPDRGKQALIQSGLFDGFELRTRFEQKETVYRMVKQEKWVIFLLLLFVVGIAALSLVGSMVMLVTDKERDRGMLAAMGGSTGLLRQVFAWEGSLITAIGVSGGMLLGVAFAWAQQAWGIVPMAGENLLMTAYPARVAAADLGWIVLGVLALGATVSILTARGVVRSN